MGEGTQRSGQSEQGWCSSPCCEEDGGSERGSNSLDVGGPGTSGPEGDLLRTLPVTGVEGYRNYACISIIGKEPGIDHRKVETSSPTGPTRRQDCERDVDTKTVVLVKGQILSPLTT